MISMLITINNAHPDPIYRQIAAQVRRQISVGELSPGMRLPTVRDLADGLGVNMHTVRQAFDLLVAEHLIEMRRGRGVTVSEGASPKALVSELTERLIVEARRMGFDDTEIVTAVQRGLGVQPA
jgi:GntR family transcriptional regulator